MGYINLMGLEYRIPPFALSTLLVGSRVGFMVGLGLVLGLGRVRIRIKTIWVG